MQLKQRIDAYESYNESDEENIQSENESLEEKSEDEAIELTYHHRHALSKQSTRHFTKLQAKYEKLVG